MSVGKRQHPMRLPPLRVNPSPPTTTEGLPPNCWSWTTACPLGTVSVRALAGEARYTIDRRNTRSLGRRRSFPRETHRDRGRNERLPRSVCRPFRVVNGVWVCRGNPYAQSHHRSAAHGGTLADR